MKIPSGLTFDTHLKTNFSVSDLQWSYLTVENNTKIQAEGIMSLNINSDTFEIEIEPSVFVPPTLEDIDNKTWKTRKLRETPPEFIAREYAQWLWKGLVRSHLKIDMGLYRAFSQWLGKKENTVPESLISLMSASKYSWQEITEKDLVAWRKVQAIKMREARKS